jgi:hypothetical protein
MVIRGVSACGSKQIPWENLKKAASPIRMFISVSAMLA